MRRFALLGSFIGLSFLFSAAVIHASDVDELRQKAKAIRQEAMELEKSGQRDKADRLIMESKMLLEKAEQMKRASKDSGTTERNPEHDRIVGRVKEEIQDLLEKQRRLEHDDAPVQVRNEIRTRIEAKEKELRKLNAQHRGPFEIPPALHSKAEHLEATARRIHHMRAAAENLKLADAHDMAHRLMEKAEIMERELFQSKQQLASEIRHPRHKPEHHGYDDIIRDLKVELEQVRREVKELRQMVDKIER